MSNLLSRKALHPERRFSESILITFLTAIVLGWLAFPLVHGATGAVLFLTAVAVLILLLRLLDRANAIWVVLGIIVGIVVDLVFHISSASLGADVLLRSFFCFWLLFVV